MATTPTKRRMHRVLNHLSHSHSTAASKEDDDSMKRRRHRKHYKYFLSMQTRWGDNDMYGHVNNVVYYSYFDSIINEYEMKYGDLDPQNDLNNDYGVYCVSASCTYLSPVAFPQTVEAGLSVERIGNSSVRYNVGIFVKDEDTAIAARAYGDFVHVFVDKKTNKPIPVPTAIRKALERILVNE